MIAKFDLIAIEPGRRAVIVDWKTSAKRPRPGWLIQRLQTRVYRYLLVRAGAALNGGQPLRPEQVEMIYWFANFPDEPERLRYDATQFEADGRYLAEMAAEIAQRDDEVFSLTDDVKRCLFCAYRSLCRRGVEAGDLDAADADTAAGGGDRVARLGRRLRLRAGGGDRVLTMNRPWLDPAPISAPADLVAAVGGHPLVAQTLARRGITTPDAARAFLDPAAYTPAPPDALPGLTAAADRLEAAIRAREPICVWGDFDVDGQTATTLLVSTLTDLGGSVTYHIPIRATEGHGVSVPILAQIIDAGARLILTCDTGIAAVEAAAYARSRGVDMIITDHHDLPTLLPDAYAIVNPEAGSVSCPDSSDVSTPRH